MALEKDMVQHLGHRFDLPGLIHVFMKFSVYFDKIAAPITICHSIFYKVPNALSIYIHKGQFFSKLGLV